MHDFFDSPKKLLFGVGAVIIVAIAAAVLAGGGQRGPAAGNPPVLPVPSPDGSLHYVSGTIVTNDGRTIVVRTQPIGRQKPVDLSVATDEKTQITIQRQKNPTLWRKEMEKFNAASSSSAGMPPAPPPPFVIETAAAGDLTAGMSVGIMPVDGTEENATAFRAAKIQALAPTPPVPAVVP